MENSMTKKKTSSLLSDALVLCIITLIAGLALGYVYEITKRPIAEREMQAKLDAYQVVYTEAASMIPDEELMEIAAVTDLKTLNPTFVGVTVDEINKVLDHSGNMLGYIIKVTTTESYTDSISLAVGYSKDGTVKGMEILSINETAGLGMNATEAKFKNQFFNKMVDQFKTTKTGATQDYEIDVISSATITTDAIVYAVNAGIGFVKEYSAEIGGGVNE